MVLETKLTAKGMFPSTPLKINQGKLDLWDKLVRGADFISDFTFKV